MSTTTTLLSLAGGPYAFIAVASTADFPQTFPGGSYTIIVDPLGVTPELYPVASKSALQFNLLSGTIPSMAAGRTVIVKSWNGVLEAAPEQVGMNRRLVGVLNPPIFAPNTTPPAVANFDPAVAATVQQTQAISFDVTDDQSLFRRVLVLVQFPNLSIYDVAHDGSQFGDRYRSQFNTKVAIPNGFRFTLLRDEGWPLSPRIVPIAIDTVGNENPVESQTYAWTLV